MEISDDIFHNSEEVIVLAATDLRDLLNVIFQQLLSEIDAFEQKGSGWVLFSLKKLTMNIIEYDPMRASSFIELPKVIKNRKACMNFEPYSYLNYISIFIIWTNVFFLVVVSFPAKNSVTS